jgi:hypothetical protein
MTFVAGVFGAGPVRAQAPLDLTIDPTEGVPGTVVTGQVDPADVAASCVTDQAEFQARFTELFNGPFVGSGTEGELVQRFFPDPNSIVYENVDQLAYVLTTAVLLGISADINGSTADAFRQSFVLTFADIATQEPVGELSTFDPTTGAGTVVTPDVDPGLLAVAAVCIAPQFDLDLLEAGIRESGEFLESIGVVFGPDGIFSPEFEAFMKEFLDTDLTGFDLFVAFVQAIGPQMLENIVVFEALGLQLFEVLAEPPQRVADVIADIEALVTAGDLRAGQARALTQVLTNALRSLENGESQAACSQLASFAAVATAKATAGALDEAEAESLIAEVQSIREQLGCDAPASPSGAFLDTCEISS